MSIWQICTVYFNIYEVYWVISMQLQPSGILINLFYWRLLWTMLHWDVGLDSFGKIWKHGIFSKWTRNFKYLISNENPSQVWQMFQTKSLNIHYPWCLCFCFALNDLRQGPRASNGCWQLSFLPVDCQHFATTVAHIFTMNRLPSHNFILSSSRHIWQKPSLWLNFV